MVAPLLRWGLFLVALIGGIDGAAVLLSLLKELHKESQAIGHLNSLSSQWCGDTSHQNLAMAQVTQGQLDDATIAVQQIRSDEKRLQSELTLARSTQQQREQQLQDATSTSNFAKAEFASEADQLSKTLEASQHAMRLLKAQLQMDADQQQELGGGADIAVNNLLQTSTSRMTNDEKSTLAGATGARPQDLLQTLTKLHARLEKEQSQTYSEQQVMSLRLWSFSDHLTSSIMESKSQAAAISMEMAQRKREHTRLDGKIGSLNSLLSKVEASKQATSAMCMEDSQHKVQIEKFIAEESDSVRVTLKKMPALSSELLFDLSNVLPAAPQVFSFLQLRGKKMQAKEHTKVRDAVSPILKDLEAMAKKFPEDTSSFKDAMQNLVSHRSSVDQDIATQKPADGIKGFATSSIQDIYAFLKSDDMGGSSALPSEERMLLSNSGDLKKVTGVYDGLLDHVHTQEKSVDDELKWCGSIARDAKVDSEAVARSLKWTGAKLNLVRVAMSEYESTMEFNKQQQNALAARSNNLQTLSDVEDSELAKSYSALKDYGQQLLALVSELAGKSNAEEHKGSAVVRGLLSRIEKHQGLLQQWRVQSKDRRQAVDSSIKALQQGLADGVKQSQRRLVKLKAESQALTSLASSKAKDKELSENYVKLSQELCSGGRAKELQAKGAKLRQEAAAVQKSLIALSQPAL